MNDGPPCCIRWYCFSFDPFHWKSRPFGFIAVGYTNPENIYTAVPQTTSCCCCTLRATCCVVICVPARVSRSRSTAAFCPSGFLCSSLLYALPCDSTRETTRRRDPTNPYALIYTCAVFRYIPTYMSNKKCPSPKNSSPSSRSCTSSFNNIY